MSDDDLVGRLIGARYRVQSKLGAGGMGAVYVALDIENGDREVALKLIKDTLVDSKEAAARFEREAAALAQIDHENIVKFIGAGVDEPNGAGSAVRYLAMERLNGKSLKERLAVRGSMPWRETLPIVRGIARALEAAHTRGLIHRDLKPDNVMLTETPAGNDAAGVKLLDFGVAKHTALPEGMTMTGTGMIVGTPGFVAPEVVLHGSSDDPRSDFYALGATWFEMLTGAKPFEAATPFALAMRHVSETPPRPTELRPFDPVPLPVEALLFRLLAKTPGERPPNAQALLSALDALEEAGARGFADDPSAAVTMTDMRTPQPMLTPSTQVMDLPAQAQPAASRLLIGGAVVAIVVALVVVIASSRDPSVPVGHVPAVTSPPLESAQLPLGAGEPAPVNPVASVVEAVPDAGTPEVVPAPVDKPPPPKVRRPPKEHRPDILPLDP